MGMASKNLEHSFQKLAAKKMKDSLSSFLPGLPGIIDTTAAQDNSSLRQLIEKPPVGGKELMLLNQLQTAGFRLHPGPLPSTGLSSIRSLPRRRRNTRRRNIAEER